MVLLAALGLLLIGAVVSTLFVQSIATTVDQKIEKIPQVFPEETLRPPKPTQGTAAQAVNILLLGSDSRGDSTELADQGLPSNQRSDTMMWMHIPADRKNVFLTSIMRDTWVTIPGFGEAKINAAMAYGGMPLVVQTLEGMFQSRIDHVAIVDFEGFKAITDALGGVEVNVPLPFTSYHGKYTFAAGPQKLDGDHALAFVRERYSFVDGDYQRVRNQQIFLKAVFKAVLSPETLSNPLRISTLVGQTAPYIRTDAGLDSVTLGKLALSLAGVRANDVISFTLPTLGTGTSADGQSIVIKDDSAIAALGKALKTDTMSSFVKSAEL